MPKVDYNSLLNKLLALKANSEEEQAGINKAIQVLTSEPFVKGNR